MGKTNIQEPEKNNLRSYKEIALFYNYLMRSIDYKGWAKYVKGIYKDLNIQGNSVLELASGTCVLAKYLLKQFPDIILSDLSKEMLLSTDYIPALKVACDMTHLPFKKKFNFIFSTFDSINYLTEENKIKKLFSSVYDILENDGYFTFDASLEANSLKYENSLNRKGKHQGIKYVQKSSYDKESRIHTNIFSISLSNGEKVEEVHMQKIYNLVDYFRLAEDCGLMVEDCYEAFTYDVLRDNSERAQFIIRKNI